MTAATLHQLESRVAALEDQLGDIGDSLQPNVLSVNPNGTIGANLTGHLAATGVDLPAATSLASQPTSSRVSWDRQSDGVAVATIVGIDTGTTGRLSSRIIHGAHSAALLLDASDNIAAVRAVADNALADLLRQDGTSDWAFATQALQAIDGEANVRIARGAVTPAAAVNFGSNFSVARTSGKPAGSYDVTITPVTFAALPVVLLTAGATIPVPGIRLAAQPDANHFTVEIFDVNTNTLTDCGFRFTATGPV